jgi:hypothetical protein
MAYAGTDCITKFLRRFADTGQTAALALLNEAATEVFSVVPYQRKLITVNLASGVYEYPLGGAYAKVWSCYYVNSSAADDYQDLAPTSTDELDADFSGWRMAQNSQPVGYYTASSATGSASGTEPGGIIGVYPPPMTTTSNGFPYLQVDVSTIPTFATGAELLPDIPFCLDAVADLMCFKRAKDARPQDAAMWGQISAQSIEQLAAIYWARNPRKPQEMRTTVFQKRSWRGNLPTASGWHPSEWANRGY